MYSHKAHEKGADRANRLNRWLRVIQVVLTAVTTGGLVVTLFGPESASKIGAALSALFSAASLGLSLYVADHDLSREQQEHHLAAVRLWAIRESYLSLIADLKSGQTSTAGAQARRDALQEQLAAVYETAPRTTTGAYRDASRGLQEREEMTFRDEEIDKFLPSALRRTPG